MIPGITDRSRLPRLGKIRLGEKRQGKRGEYPAALDHFSFRDTPELEEVFGRQCREIYPVLIPVEQEDTWFHTSRSAYTKSGLFCRCSDGETAIRVNKGLDKNKPLDPQGWRFLQEQGLEVDTGEMFEMPCPGEECLYFQKGWCKNLGRLQFFVLASPKFGVYEIATTSINSIRNVLSSARAIRAQAGRITSIPLALRLVPMQVSPEGKAKTVYVLELQFRDGGIGKLLDISRSAGALPRPQLVEPPAKARDVPDDLYPEGGRQLGRVMGDEEPGPEEPQPQPQPQPEPSGEELPTQPSELFAEDRGEGDERRNESRERVRQATARHAASQQPTPPEEPELDF